MRKQKPAPPRTIHAAHIMVIFIAVQLLGLLVAWQLIQQQIALPWDPNAPENSFILFGYILLGTALMLGLIRFYKGALVFRLLEALVIFIAGDTVFGLFLNEPAGIIAGAALVAGKWLQPRLRNIVAGITSAGVGALLGVSLSIVPVLILMGLLAVYDVVAVFLTRHMITLAKEISKRELAFSVAVRHDSQRMELGGGDLVIPVMLASAAMHVNVMVSAATVVGSAIGIAAVLWIAAKRGIPLPAMPALAAAGAAGLLIGMALF